MQIDIRHPNLSRRAMTLALATALVGGFLGWHTFHSPSVTSQPAPAASPARSHTIRASWYGSGFNGQRTADGEIFNEHSFTAASKTLPLGSRIQVTNQATGRSVVVKVNDRGPFVRGRSLDLSKAAARQIGTVHEGVAKVTITPVHAANGPAASERRHQDLSSVHDNMERGGLAFTVALLFSLPWLWYLMLVRLGELGDAFRVSH